MEELLNRIHQVEVNHLHKLHASLNRIFRDVSLPSHDLNHHVRVWLFCRGLLVELHKAGLEIPTELIENAIIACFYHDTGLTQTLDEQHGSQSAQLCRLYLNELPNMDEDRKTAILTAVELHDDKSIKNKPVTKPEDLLNLNLLISTADDLDALGFIGVFRYTEIYLKRGITINDLPRKVSQNLRNRFTSFTNAFSSLHRYADRQRLRYRETIDFFARLDSEIAQGISNQDSALTVIHLLNEQLVIKNQSIEQTIDYALNTLTASFPLHFFKKLQSELEVTTAIPLT